MSKAITKKIKGSEMKTKITVILALIFFSYSTSMAEITVGHPSDPEPRARMGEIKENMEFHRMIDSAAEVYISIAKGKHGEVPLRVLEKARCIAILPNVVTGALVIGATHGTGIATCKNSDNAWSQPASISLNEGSIGLQAGAKSTDLVLFFQNNLAVKALKSGNFALGTDVSAVAGKYDSKIDTSTASVLVYARTGGLFAGVSVNGSKISQNRENIKTYYGRDADFSDLLEGKESPDSSGYSRKLINLLPKM